MNYSPSHCTSDHILVIDDDSKLRRLLQKFLREKGFIVSIASSAQDAMRLQESLEFDVLVLDIMMPELNGFEYLRLLRKKSALPVILLSARGEAQDRIEGLEIGADDYLPKPFEPKELLLRINAILRRMPETPAEETTAKILYLGPIRYDIERGEMWQGEDPVRLTATESQLMKIFSAQPGEPISRAKLVEDLGRDKGQAQERAVDVQITRLRRKLETDPKQPRYLQTVRGEGYMLVPD